ncbi:MAG: S49 family peptidase, partial [Candidatus Brocadiaceae bacterium]|nr:S49 family peptidase [Candidatus Brocadiaceae bacterium]
SLNNILHAVKDRLDFNFTGEKMDGVQLIENESFQYTVIDNVAFIPLQGALVHKGSAMDAMCGIMNYAEIGNMLNTAIADPQVTKIVFDCNSGGGTVAGAFTLAEKVFNARGNKELIAVVDEAAYSACYLVASACDRIVLSKTSGVGSIGVVSAHYDYSDALKSEGVAVTYVYAGDKKVDANPYEALKDSAKIDMQNRVDKFYNMFVNEVSKNRGISAETIIGTQAGIYIGEDAVKIGLADEVVNLNDFYKNLSIETKNKGAFMSADKIEENKVAEVAEVAQPAEEAKQEIAEPTQELKAEAKTEEVEAVAEVAEVEQNADLKKYMQSFGDAEGAKMFVEGITFEAAQQQHITSQDEKIENLEAKIAEQSLIIEAGKKEIGGEALQLGATEPKAVKKSFVRFAE